MMQPPRSLLRDAGEATARTIAWFGVPVLLAVEWTLFGWRVTLLLTASHALAVLAGLLGNDRVKAHLREALAWVGEWNEARKGADLRQLHEDETGEHKLPPDPLTPPEWVSGGDKPKLVELPKCDCGADATHAFDGKYTCSLCLELFFPDGPDPKVVSEVET